jgi:BirA family biotin operon repressor/biotin-[acetyl-CoA-carboxylase] ligase
MILAHARATDPAVRSGTVVVAEEQSAGRGRQQRRWDAPPGQALLMSLILKAPLPVPLPQIPMAAGLAALTALTTTFPVLHEQVGLKWPNDLLLGHDMADAGKVGGILVENSFYGAALTHVVVGIGINILQEATALPPGLPGAPAPTSLAHYLATRATPPGSTFPPPAPDRTALLLALCQAWAQLLWPPPATALPPLVDRWRAHLWTLGESVVVHGGAGTTATPDVPFHGRAIDVTTEGHLLVRAAAGDTRSFAAGDVSVRRPAA